jgi:hypothetical protein
VPINKALKAVIEREGVDERTGAFFHISTPPGPYTTLVSAWECRRCAALSSFFQWSPVRFSSQVSRRHTSF